MNIIRKHLREYKVQNIIELLIKKVMKIKEEEIHGHFKQEETDKY